MYTWLIMGIVVLSITVAMQALEKKVIGKPEARKKLFRGAGIIAVVGIVLIIGILITDQMILNSGQWVEEVKDGIVMAKEYEQEDQKMHGQGKEYYRIEIMSAGSYDIIESQSLYENLFVGEKIKIVKNNRLNKKGEIVEQNIRIRE